MSEQKSFLEKLWVRVHNNKVTAVLIVIGGILTGLIYLLQGAFDVFKRVDDLTQDRQTIKVIKPNFEKINSEIFNKNLKAKFDLANDLESDIINVSNEKLSLDFSINNEIFFEIQKDPRSLMALKNGYMLFNTAYRLEVEDNVIKIQPFNSYLSHLKNGNPIKPIYVPQVNQPPSLDLKIVNNSKETVFFTHAVFEISSSVFDPFPIITFDDPISALDYHYGGTLSLINRGWGKVINCTIFFDIVSTSEEPNYEKKFEYELNIGGFDHFKDSVNLHPFLKAEGVQVELIKDYYFGEYSTPEMEKAILGPFNDGKLLMYGKIVYQGLKSDRTYSSDTINFENLILLESPLLGYAIQPVYFYDVEFEIEKDKYRRVLPISHVLRSGESSWFNIKIAAPKSSRHLFSLHLIYNENQMLSIPNVYLNYGIVTRRNLKKDQEIIINTTQ